MKSISIHRPLALLLGTLLLACNASTAFAQNYKIDPGHSFIQFRISHLGFSILNGRFNTLQGDFYYDPINPNKTSFNLEVDTASIDSNHAERDKHLRDEDFLDVKKFPKATFKSATFHEDGKTATLFGELQLHGVTKRIEIYVQHIGNGEDPWGGYRRGFKGQTSILLKDFGITKDLGKASENLLLDIYIEGIREQ